jgi:hypothetical protein
MEENLVLEQTGAGLSKQVNKIRHDRPGSTAVPRLESRHLPTSDQRNRRD